MRFIKPDYFSFFLILIISLLFVLDFFMFLGRPATFDGNVHVTIITQFYNILSHGQLPLAWLNDFANYGLPVSLFIQQLPLYLGAFLMFVTHDPVTAYNLVVLIGIFFSCLFYYFFLRFYFSPVIAFAATFLFNFEPYRIINFYIRGALPEGFAAIFLPLMLIGIHYLIKEKKILGFYLIVFAIAGLTLSHPFTLILFGFIFLPYFFFLLATENNSFSLRFLFNKRAVKMVLVFLFALLIGLGISSYYIVPLNLEIKYLYYGQLKNHLSLGQYMGLNNFFDPNWYYFYNNDVFTRGHFIQAGLIEVVGVAIGIVVILFTLIKNKFKKVKIGLFEFSVVISLLIIFFTTKFSDVFYKNINLLSNIQLPWRMFAPLGFLPPILYATYLKKLNNKLVILIFILLICVIRFPQLYGKNYVVYPQSSYDFTKYNLQAVVMNTIWTGKSEDYPNKIRQSDIIEGEGFIVSKILKNSSRSYQIDAKTPLKMVDYTFYFPGWNVYVDNIKTNIEFQNPNYRGVITYNVPAGNHSVSVMFEDTKVRLLGKILSVIFLSLFIVLFFLRKRISKVLNIF